MVLLQQSAVAKISKQTYRYIKTIPNKEVFVTDVVWQTVIFLDIELGYWFRYNCKLPERWNGKERKPSKEMFTPH